MKRLAFTLIAGLLTAGQLAEAQTPAPAKKEETVRYAKAADIPVEVFFKRAQYASMSISPDGKTLAGLVPAKGRNNLVSIDLESRKATLLTSFEQFDVTQLQWINNSRLLFRVADARDVAANVQFKGTFAVDTNGENLRKISHPAEKGVKRDPPLQFDFSILARTGDESGDVLVEMNERTLEYVDVYRYNTKTGNFRILTFDSPGQVQSWVLDRDLNPRIAVRREDRKDKNSPQFNSIWHRAPGENSKWEKIGEVSSVGDRGSISPIAFDFDNKTLYVASNINRDKRAIYKYDIATGKLGDLVAEHPLVDLGGGMIFSRKQKALLGVNYNADRQGTAWFDDGFAKLQAAFDKSFPNHINAIFPSENTSRMLVYSYSDVDPGTYYLFDGEKRSMEKIADTQPWLDPKLMSERKFIKYKARDGMEIPAWVTIPRNSDGKNLPLIVNIHGGPWARTYSWAQWGLPEAQFFASRGYVVLEPEPRGSTGFGRKHYVSGFKQWGLTMQDDITDGALHLVKEGIVDKNRMCLHGGSYGGYATLQGLVKDPDLWRCGTPFVAVTDLGLMQTVSWSDMFQASDFLQTDFKVMVGDKDADSARFQETSPARNAARIKAPILLAMGEEDVRVPLIHGTRMRDALKDAGKKFEFIIYPGEAHGWNKDENNFDFYRRIEKFFAENLK